MIEISTGVTYHLEPGDVIITINGRRLNDYSDFENAVMSSPRTMELSVRDRRTGRTKTFRTILTY